MTVDAAMVLPETGPCPVHAPGSTVGCDWCELPDRAAVLEQIRTRLEMHLRMADPEPLIISLVLRSRVGDALVIEVTVSLPGRRLQLRRFLVKPDATLALD
jgi:hypothetical protein